MKGLAELVLSLCELCEAEGRLLQENVLRTLRRALLLSLGLIFGAAALAFLVAATYVTLSTLLPKQYALCLMAFVCTGIAILLCFNARCPGLKRSSPARGAGAQDGKPGTKGSGLDLNKENS